MYRALIEACRLEMARVRMVELVTALPDLMELVLAEGVGIAVQGLTLLNAIVQVCTFGYRCVGGCVGGWVGMVSGNGIMSRDGGQETER